MTQPARHALPPPADIDEALQRIRDHGGRITAGKRALVHLLYGDDDASFTLDDITARMVDHDRSTIYRMLNQFEELGIAEHLHLGHGQAVHRAAGRATVPVVCSMCGSGIDLERAPDALVRPPRRRTHRHHARPVPLPAHRHLPAVRRPLERAGYALAGCAARLTSSVTCDPSWCSTVTVTASSG